MKVPARWAELSPLFDELIELDRAARAVRLRELTRNEPELARDLTAMLQTAEQARERRFLAQQPALDTACVLSMQGRRIGHYLIEEELGQGGSGSVWKARCVDGRFDGFVAIKLLHMSLIRPLGVARFQREGALLSRLSHPDIVRLLDSGLTPNGQPYLVLDYVDGMPIDQYCDLNRVGLHGRLQLLRAVMESISHAHAELIVHRDIKPSNILVTPRGRVKLLDFGIAKLLEDESESADLTMDGQRVLTPRYAAPEQLEGARVTACTDVYSLGVLMYRLLVGRYPTSVEGASAAAVITGTLTVAPSRLASALERVPSATEGDARQIAVSRDTTVKGLKRQVHGDLDAIVSRALRKLPGQRYDSVAAFAADIGRYLDGRPLSARTGSRRYRLGKFVQRHKAVAAASALLTLAVVVAPIGAAGQAPRVQREQDVALRQSRGTELTTNGLGVVPLVGGNRREVHGA